MSIKNSGKGLEEMFVLFEDKISSADINAADCMGKISAAIVKQRIEMDMTQKEFAKYLDVSQGMVSRWEGGDYNFTIKGLADIVEKLGLKLDISIRESKDNIEINELENTNYEYATSGKKVYVGKASKVINFSSKASSMKAKHCDIENMYDIKENLEM